ncbi:MAG: hypothetical protein IPL53_13180 [Ignavibacteria bacterium]|nr:hypothetical protein [Ignavibacteria bacterium]
MYLFIIYILLLNLSLSDVNESSSISFNEDPGNATNSSACVTTWKNTLKISDAGNVKDSLIFGTSLSGSNGIDTCLGEKILPPVPPGGAYDVRFVIQDGHTKIDIRKDTTVEMSWTIQFQPSPSGYPITFTWANNVFPSRGYYYLKDNIGGSVVNVNMRNQSSYTLTNSGISLLKIEYTSVKINLKAIPEGFYFPLFNQLSRRDTFSVFLRNIAAPHTIADSARGVIDSITFSNVFTFPKATAGGYYIVVKHLYSIETWSKSGGTNVTAGGVPFNYDFTTSAIQAYGNNLQLKSGKYCLFGGDVDRNGFIDLTDVIKVFNDSKNFFTGRYLPADLNGDSIVDLTDITLCYNNSINFIAIKRP